MEKLRFFSNGRLNLHIEIVPRSCRAGNQAEMLVETPKNMKKPKNLVLKTMSRFTIIHIGLANGLVTMYDKTPGRMTSAQNETKYVASDLLGHNNKHIKCGNGRTTPCMKNIKIKHNTAYTDNLS